MIETTNPNFIPEPALYSKQQASMFLNVSVRTIGNLLRTKQLVRRKIGTRTLIPVSSLHAFLTKDHGTGK
jgi:excisionase family DNA binding protein